ncbi:MAG: hypothetical protein AAGN66_09740 [Acidobacteriota bacterium]
MSTDLGHLTFLLQLGATLALTGLIWTIQVVQYPLFAKVGAEAFTGYHVGHSQRITWVVVPLMLAELATALAWMTSRPAGVPAWAAWLGLGLVAVVWLSTAFLQVPQHGILSVGFDPGAHRFLVVSNWLRTAAWSARGLLMLWLTHRLIQS